MHMCCCRLRLLLLRRPLPRVSYGQPPTHWRCPHYKIKIRCRRLWSRRALWEAGGRSGCFAFAETLTSNLCVCMWCATRLFAGSPQRTLKPFITTCDLCCGEILHVVLWMQADFTACAALLMCCEDSDKIWYCWIIGFEIWVNYIAFFPFLLSGG